MTTHAPKPWAELINLHLDADSGALDDATFAIAPGFITLSPTYAIM